MTIGAFLAALGLLTILLAVVHLISHWQTNRWRARRMRQQRDRKVQNIHKGAR